MSRPIISTLLLLLLALGIYAREWLIQKEVGITERQLKDQLAQQIETAPSVDRVRQLTSSSVVYERFLEPVILETNRLLWPFSREAMITDWKRIVHTKLDDLAQARILNLQGQFESAKKSLRESSEPSVARLYQILEKFDTSAANGSCRQTAEDEMKAMAVAAHDKDDKTLASIKEQGLAAIHMLKSKLRKMNNSQVGVYVRSGKYFAEVEQPILSLVFQISQKEVRQSTWNEFQKKISEIFGKKRVDRLASIESARQKQFEKLFKPLAEAYAEPRTPASQLTPPSPSDAAPAAPDTELPYDAGN